MRRIGILGGTFDPPHLGHLILAEFAASTLELDILLFVPAGDPPHKQNDNKIPLEHRLAMVELAVADNSRFSISRADVDRPGPHYSIDMVQIIQRQYPEAALFFVMGGDSLRDLPHWHRPADFIRLCKLAVMRRPDDDLTLSVHSDVLPELAERVVMIDAPLIGISSTEIAERLRTKQSIRYLVPEAVRIYIEQHGLYAGSET